MVLDAPVLQGLATSERTEAMHLLAQLLLEASGLIDEEEDDREDA